MPASPIPTAQFLRPGVPPASFQASTRRGRGAGSAPAHCLRCLRCRCTARILMTADFCGGPCLPFPCEAMRQTDGTAEEMTAQCPQAHRPGWGHRPRRARRRRWRRWAPLFRREDCQQSGILRQCQRSGRFCRLLSAFWIAGRPRWPIWSRSKGRSGFSPLATRW